MISRRSSGSMQAESVSVDGVLAEYRLVFAEAKVPQPLAHIHDGRPPQTSCCTPIMSAMGSSHTNRVKSGKLILTRCCQLWSRKLICALMGTTPPSSRRTTPALWPPVASTHELGWSMASARRRGGLRATKIARDGEKPPGGLRLTCVMFGYLGTRLESRWSPFLRLTRLDCPALYRS
jgi:hypothetical protein